MSTTEIELSVGMIDYEDTGGDGPAVVLLHGLLMSGSLWRNVVCDLRADHRCVVPTLPLGGHRRPMRPDADLSGRGQARLVAELLERLDLTDVTLVGSDWGGAQLVVSEGCDERVGRLVPCAQEAFDNFPPGLPGRAIGLAARVGGGLGAALAPLVLRTLRRTPLTFGWMSRRPVPDEVMDAWLRPALSQAAIRRDLRRYIRTSDRHDYLRAAEDLRSFRRPALVVWGTHDLSCPWSTLAG